jgi:toxin ParE1/3/4
MSHKVIFTPEAEAQLIELYRYIAAAESPEVVARYTNSIVTTARACRPFHIEASSATISGPAYVSRTTENAL